MRTPQTLEVYKLINGPTGFVPGRGADIVPGKVGNGEVMVDIRPDNQESNLERDPLVEKVIARISGNTSELIWCVREGVDYFVQQGQEITEDLVLKILEGLPDVENSWDADLYEQCVQDFVRLDDKILDAIKEDPENCAEAVSAAAVFELEDRSIESED